MEQTKRKFTNNEHFLRLTDRQVEALFSVCHVGLASIATRHQILKSTQLINPNEMTELKELSYIMEHGQTAMGVIVSARNLQYANLEPTD